MNTGRCIKRAFRCFFFFFNFNALTAWGLADTGKDCPSQGNLIPRISKDFGSHLPGHCASALITLRPGTRRLGTTPSLRGCGSCSHEAILHLLSLLTLARSFLPRETAIKALVYLFPLFPLPPG